MRNGNNRKLESSTSEVLCHLAKWHLIGILDGDVSTILGSFSFLLYTVYLKLFRYQGRSALMIVSSSYGLRTCLVLRRLS